MSGLGLDTSEFVAPKTSFGLQAAFSSFEEKVVASIKGAVQKIVEEDYLADLESIKEVHKEIKALYQNIKGLPDRCSDLVLKKHLRFLIKAIDQRLDSCDLPKKEVKSIRASFLKISEDIGVVPELNPCVEQPDAEYLPPEYKVTIESWKEDKECEKAYFFTKKDKEGHTIASVRRHLLALDSAKDASLITKALSYADGDFYFDGDLEADHLQPANILLSRQLELVEFMNLDSLFAEGMMADPRGYFIESEGVYYGSKLFFMDYYNCVDNVWLINPSKNKGEKGKQDPLKWLAAQEKFDRFFDAIGGQDSIVKSTLLYTTSDGRVLCKAAKEWFREVYAEEIVAAGFIFYAVAEPARILIADAKKADTPKARIKAMSSYAAMNILAIGSPSKTPEEVKKHKASRQKESLSGKKAKKTPKALAEPAGSESDDELFQRLPLEFSEINKENIHRMQAMRKHSPVKRARRHMLKVLTSLYVESFDAEPKKKVGGAKKKLAISAKL